MGEWFYHTDSKTMYREIEFDESNDYEFVHLEMLAPDGFHIKYVVESKNNLFSLTFEKDKVSVICQDSKFMDAVLKIVDKVKGKSVDKNLVLAVFNEVYITLTK